MSQFLDNLSGHFGLNQAEINSVVRNITSKDCVADEADINPFDVLVEEQVSEDHLNSDKLDYIELFLAVSLNAKMRDATQDPRYKKLKLLLNNNSQKAVNLANLWMDGKLSYDKMLATI